MSHNVLVLDGLDQLRAALLALPAELTTDAGKIVADTAARMSGEERLNYPRGPTGNLQSHVRVEIDVNRFGAGATVRSAAKHASWFEYGTNPRRVSTWRKKPLRKPANRGHMNPGPTDSRVIPRAIRLRTKMTDQLVELVRSAGFEVVR